MKRSVWIGLALLSLYSAVFVRAAGTNEPSFQVFETLEPVPENGSIPGLRIKSTRGNCRIAPPGGWGVTVNKEDYLLHFRDPRLRAGITLTLLEKSHPTEKEILGMIKEEAPNAGIGEKTQVYTASLPGVAFAAQERIGGKFDMQEIFAYIPHRKGTLRLRLIVPPENFDACHIPWSRLLNSLKIEQE